MVATTQGQGSCNPPTRHRTTPQRITWSEVGNLLKAHHFAYSRVDNDLPILQMGKLRLGETK